MAKFLNTSATNFFLEELIKNAKERLILISPYLRLNDRIKELLEDKNRLKIDIRIVYGKSDLHPDEIKWMQRLVNQELKLRIEAIFPFAEIEQAVKCSLSSAKLGKVFLHP